MRVPWTTTAQGEIVPVEPEQWLFEPGAWSEVEATFGTSLPRDYKELIGTGLACTFDEELVIASPFDPNPNLNLIVWAARSSWALASLRRSDPGFSVAAYPEPGGLFAWGADGGGAVYHWDSTDPDPDRWTVCIEGRPIHPEVQRHAMGLTGYLDALGRGEIKPAALAGWPGPNPRIERRAAVGRPDPD
jgi:hypothetical protein